MRRLDVARGVDGVLVPVRAVASDAAPLVLRASLALGEVVVAPDTPFDVSLLVPFGMPLVARVESLRARVESVVAGVAGRVRSTSPDDVLVTLRAGDTLPLDRMQSVVIAESVVRVVAPAVVVADETLPLVAVPVEGVVPVPFAPFVVFSPVKR
jgi:hypothetical protein